MLRVSINGREISNRLIMNTIMGFGQGSSDGRVPERYCLQIDLLTLKYLISDIYNHFVEIDKQDDEEVDEDCPEIQTLRDLNHPPLDDVIVRHPTLLADLIINHFPVEFLSSLFPTSDDEIKEREFNINSIEKIEIQLEKLKLYGDIFPINH